MAINVGEIEATLRLRDELSAQMKKAEATVTQFGSSVKQVGAGLTLALTVPLTAIGTAAFRAAKELDSAFDDIRIGTGAVGRDLQDLQKNFQNVFRSVPNDAQQVSFAITELRRRLDLTGPALEAMATQVLTLSRITKTDLNTVLPQTTRLFNDWSVATSEQSKTLDFLFRTSQTTGVALDRLLDGVTGTGAAFRALGFDLETSAALIGQFEREGVNAEQVIGALQIAARKFADQNIPLQEGLQQVVKQIQDLGPGTASAKLAFEVFGRSSTGMAEAIQRGRLNVEELLKTLRGSRETILGAAEATDGFAEKWAIFRNNLTAALEPLGNRLLVVLEQLQPVFLGVVESLTTAAEWFGKLPASVQTTAVVIAGLGAAAGPAALAVEGLTAAVGALRGALGLLALNPLTLGLFAVGGAAIYAATQIKELNDRTNAMIQKQRDLKTVDDFTEKLRKGLQVSADDIKQYQDALKRLDQSLDKSKGKAVDLGGGFGGLKINLDDAQKGLDGIGASTAGANQQFDFGKKELSEFQKAVLSLKRTLSGVDIEEEIAATAAALEDLNSRGIAVTKAKLPGLVKQIDEWRLAGFKVPPILADIRAKNISMVGPITNVGDAFDDFTRTLQNHWPAVERTGDAHLKTSQAIKEFNKMVRESNSADILKSLPNILDQFPLKAPPLKLTEKIEASLLEAANAFPEMLSQAILHGRGIGEAFRSLLANAGADLGKLLGETFGREGSRLAKFLGSAFSALGAIGGDLIGKAFSALININKNVTKETREEFAKSMGFDNLGKLYDDLRTLGLQGQKLADLGLNVIGRKDEAANRRWMADVQKFYDTVQKEIDDVGKALDRTDMLWTKAMGEFVRNTPAFGDVIKKQLTGALGGLTQFLTRGADATKAVADIKDQIAKLDGNEITGIAQQWDALNKQLVEQENILKAVGVTSQETADAFGASIAGIFGSLLKNGVGIVDAVEQITPAVRALQTQLDAAGLSGGDAFNSVKGFVDLVGDSVAGPVLQAVQGLDAALIGLQNTGLLNQQTFSALTGQITQAFQSLVAQGKDGDQVLRLMQGPLQTIWELQKDFGFAVDESTQALLDQAAQAGIVGDKFRDPLERMIAGLDRMASILEAIAIKMGALPAAASQAAGGIEQSFRDIKIDVPVKFRVEDLPSLSPEVPGFAEGTQGKYIDFGAGTLAMLHGRERVMTEGESAGGGGMLTVVVEADGRTLSQVVAPYLPYDVKRYKLA